MEMHARIHLVGFLLLLIAAFGSAKVKSGEMQTSLSNEIDLILADSVFRVYDSCGDCSRAELKERMKPENVRWKYKTYEEIEVAIEQLTHKYVADGVPFSGVLRVFEDMGLECGNDSTRSSDVVFCRTAKIVHPPALDADPDTAAESSILIDLPLEIFVKFYSTNDRQTLGHRSVRIALAPFASAVSRR